MSLEIKVVAPLGDLAGKETIAEGESRAFKGSFGKRVTALVTEEGLLVTELMPARWRRAVL